MSGPRFAVTTAIRFLLLAACSAARAQTSSVAPETIPLWAFPLTSSTTSPTASQQEYYTLPGSTRKFSSAQLRDRTTAVDWFPGDHPAMPAAVRGGSGPLACGFCHLPDGQGRPENASLAGLPYAYLMQQLSDMKSGARQLADPHFVPGSLMLQAAAQTPDAAVDQAARYFSDLRYAKRVKVVEAASIPSSRADGYVYVFDATAPRQPLGARIVEGPNDFSRFEERDSRTTYTAYVPAGSVARGAALAKGNGKARQACVTCHGSRLQGGPIGPPLAGRSPTGIFRQLYAFQLGTRHGPGALLMKPIVADLSRNEMIALAAYAGSLRQFARALPP